MSSMKPRSILASLVFLGAISTVTLSAQSAARVPPRHAAVSPSDSIDIVVALVEKLDAASGRAQIVRWHGHRSQGMILVTPATGAIDLVSAIESFVTSRRAYGDDLGVDVRRTVRHDLSPSRFDPAEIVQAQRKLMALHAAPAQQVPHIGFVPALTLRVPSAVRRN